MLAFLEAKFIYRNIQEAGIANLTSSTLVVERTGKTLRKLGCEYDAIKIRTESSAFVYLCYAKHRFTLLGDPDDPLSTDHSDELRF